MIEADQILAKMKNQKINYDKVLRKMISQWEREGSVHEFYYIVVVHHVVLILWNFLHNMQILRFLLI